MSDEGKPAEPPKKSGVDLSRLLAKAKPLTPATPAAGEVPAAVPAAVAASPTKPPVAPSKPIGVGGRSGLGEVGTKGGVQKQQGPLAAPVAGKPAATPRALVAAAPVNRQIEALTSRQGQKADKLNVVQREERKYPFACFGVDELYVFAETMFNAVRANVWKAKDQFPTFTLGLRYIGSVRREYSTHWDGSKFTTDWSQISGTPDALATIEADLAIDYVRGVMSCVATEMAEGLKLDDPKSLLWALRVMRWKFENEELTERLKAVDDDIQERKQQAREQSSDAVDFLVRFVSFKIEKAAQWIVGPLFLRFIIQADPAVEVLFHFQKGQFTVLRGKPGETLSEGAVDVTVTKRGLQAMWDREIQFHFAFLSGLFTATGDLDVLRTVQLCGAETIRRIRAFNISHQPSSQAAPLLLDVRAKP